MAFAGCRSHASSDAEAKKTEQRAGSIVTRSTDDQELAAASARARATLKEFRAALAKPQPAFRGFSLKITAREGDQVEQLWLGEIEIVREGFEGVIDHVPRNLPKVRVGDRRRIREEDVEDWTYFDGAERRGGETIRVLLRRMGEAAVPSSSAGQSRKPALQPPRFRVAHVFPKETDISSVGSKLIACESWCVWKRGTSPLPRTWLVDAEHVEEDASLLPQIGSIAGPRVHYMGRYPDDVIAIIRYGYEEDAVEEAFRYTGRGAGNRFKSAPLPYDHSRPRWLPGNRPCRERCEPFEKYMAQKKADWERISPGTGVPSPEAMLFGQGGAMLVLEYHDMSIWDGVRWVKSRPPWCSADDAVRLANGASLVRSLHGETCDQKTDNEVFWISPSGEPSIIDLGPFMTDLGLIHFRSPIDLGREIWLIAEAEAGTVLLAPVVPSEVMRALE